VHEAELVDEVEEEAGEEEDPTGLRQSVEQIIVVEARPKSRLKVALLNPNQKAGAVTILPMCKSVHQEDSLGLG